MLEEIAATAAVHDRDGSFPFDSLALLQKAGILSLTVPIALGGGGAGLALAAEAVSRVGAACPATALVLAMQFVRQAAIARSGIWPLDLRQRIGREAVTDGALINALRVEPELGSPTRGGLPATVARLRAGHWSISGHKRYATGAPGLRWMEVLARTEEERPRIGTFLVPADARGVALVETWNHLGLRASGSHDVVLTEVAVPLDHAIGLVPAAEWGRPDPVQSAWTTMLVSAVYTGAARAARDWILRFLHARVPSNLGAPLATLPRVIEAVGAIEAALAANARITEAVTLATDAGFPPTTAESGLLKVTLADNAVLAVERAVALAGNHAHDRAHALERHWRDVQCARVHVPTADAAHLAAGRAALAAVKPQETPK
ncbi:acyl-CoA/acyl-ACP dehydrogenase [Roseomonas sp. JC162]|uniref:Acyl-CoA/acyl-ACP dehydrogenase n=2 Tax=Neoroseomonas marina TaxID=1232220 RepID=A0A848EM77_9PROT|nr:acyl-CoA dehydrogenase family protein [Neoroseomonas marina]NMJ44473.1 acyl-CoA/acyl-ACP dehydrogenase [Neoroseomonas marina]